MIGDCIIPTLGVTMQGHSANRRNKVDDEIAYVHVKVTKAMKEKAVELAKSNDLSFSQWIRKIIAARLLRANR